MAGKKDKQNNKEEELKRDWIDDIERKQAHDYKVGIRKTPLSNNILAMLSDMLQPQTVGFSQVNLDMSFTYLDPFDVLAVNNSSFLVTFFKLYGFKKSEYMERSTLATFLNAKRSQHGKSMDLFTTTVTKSESKYMDSSDKKVGWFGGFGMKKKGDEQ